MSKVRFKMNDLTSTGSPDVEQQPVVDNVVRLYSEGISLGPSGGRLSLAALTKAIITVISATDVNIDSTATTTCNSGIPSYCAQKLESLLREFFTVSPPPTEQVNPPQLLQAINTTIDQFYDSRRLFSRFKVFLSSLFTASTAHRRQHRRYIQWHNLTLTFSYLYQAAPEKMVKCDEHFELAEALANFWISLLSLDGRQVNKRKALNRSLAQLQLVVLLALENLFQALALVGLTVHNFFSCEQKRTLLNVFEKLQQIKESSHHQVPLPADHLLLWQIKFQATWFQKHLCYGSKLPPSQQHQRPLLKQLSSSELDSTVSSLLLRNDSIGSAHQWVTVRSRLPLTAQTNALFYETIVQSTDGSNIRIGLTTLNAVERSTEPIGSSVPSRSIGFTGSAVYYCGLVKQLLPAENFRPVKSGDILGVLLKPDDCAFYINGECCFTAREHFAASHPEALFLPQFQTYYAAISLRTNHSAVSLNFTGPFLYPPLSEPFIPAGSVGQPLNLLEPKLLDEQSTEFWYPNETLVKAILEEEKVTIESNQLRYFPPNETDEYFIRFQNDDDKCFSLRDGCNQQHSPLKWIHSMFFHMDVTKAKCGPFASWEDKLVEGFQSAVKHLEVDSRLLEMFYPLVTATITANTATPEKARQFNATQSRLHRNLLLIFCFIFDPHYVTQHPANGVHLGQLISNGNLLEFYAALLADSCSSGTSTTDKSTYYALVSLGKMFQQAKVLFKSLDEKKTNRTLAIIMRKVAQILEQCIEQRTTAQDSAVVATAQLAAIAEWLLSNLSLRECLNVPVPTSIGLVFDNKVTSEQPVVQLTAHSLVARNDLLELATVRCPFPVFLSHGDASIFYYETTILSSGQAIQLGWMAGVLKGTVKVGDSEHSVAVDGHRRVGIENKVETGSFKQLPQWQPGDIVGSLLDAVQSSVTFYLNGVLLFEATTSLSSTEPYFAAVTLGPFQQVRFNFGAEPFRFSPSGRRQFRSFELPYRMMKLCQIHSVQEAEETTATTTETTAKCPLCLDKLEFACGFEYCWAEHWIVCLRCGQLLKRCPTCEY